MASVWWRRSLAASAILTGLAGVLVTTAACSPGPPNATQGQYERVARLVLPSVVQIQAGKSTGSGVVFESPSTPPGRAAPPPSRASR
jgi:hypothetical protein